MQYIAHTLVLKSLTLFNIITVNTGKIKQRLTFHWSEGIKRSGRTTQKIDKQTEIKTNTNLNGQKKKFTILHDRLKQHSFKHN